MARLYDALHDPSQRDTLTTVDRHGIRHIVLHAELLGRRVARRARCDRALGAACPTASWAARPTTRRRSWPRWARIRSSTRRSSRTPATGIDATPTKALFLNHVLINPPVDRNEPVHEVADVFVHVVRETRRRHRRVGREDARDRLGADARHVRRAEQRRARSRPARPRTTRSSSSRRWTRPGTTLLCRPSYEHNAHSPVRPSALQPLRRERRGADLRRGVHPLGERARLPRRRAGELASTPRPGSSTATTSRRARASP